MRVQISETTPTPAHAVKCGDRVRERGTGEVREVVGLGGTITRRIFTLDDGTYLEAGVLDTMFVARADLGTTKGTNDD